MAVIKVEGMSCQHCVNAVTKALEALDGVKNVRVSLEKAQAEYDESQPVDQAAVKAAVEKAGYRLG